jgi:hypothetical protein
MIIIGLLMETDRFWSPAADKFLVTLVDQFENVSEGQRMATVRRNRFSEELHDDLFS